MNKGILYGVGIGPGDPELLTLKAVRILQQADMIAVPSTGESRQTALAIAAEYVQDKPLMDCPMPMIRDKAKLAENYDRVTEMLAEKLDAGKNIAFITLGDPSVYSTYIYLHRRLCDKGYDARIIPGVPSFCAAAAALNRPLCEGSQMLHVIPASHGATEEGLALSGTRVLMKAGRSLGEVRRMLAERGELAGAGMVENCGLAGERIVQSMEDCGDESGYFSLIIVKEDAE